MRSLNNVNGTRAGDERHTEAEEEATTHELGDARVGDSGSGDDGAHDDQEGSDNHTTLSTPGINTGTDEWERHNTANLVHCRDDTSPGTIVRAVEVFQEIFLICRQTTEERSVVTVYLSSAVLLKVAHGLSTYSWSDRSIPEANKT
jgi:hypothetical protein